MVRNSISLTMVFAFLLLIISSIILYIAPEGRIAYWGDWHIIGLTKSQWSNVHITGGFLFLGAGLWHVILNSRPIINYIKRGTKGLTKSTWPVAIGLGVNVFFFIATLMDIQPAKQLVVWNADIKEYRATTLGMPPYGHAELSTLEQFCGFLGFNVDEVVTNLKSSSLKGEITRKTTILDIAQQNNKTPQQVFVMIKDSISADPFALLPPASPEGTGKLTLQKMSENNNLPIDEVMKKLQAAGIDAQPSETFKQVAEKNNKRPDEIYLIIRN